MARKGKLSLIGGTNPNRIITTGNIGDTLEETLRLPLEHGSLGQVLADDGTGVLEWVDKISMDELSQDFISVSHSVKTVFEDTAVELPWDTQQNVGDTFLHVLSGTEIEITKAGKYTIGYSVTVESTSDSNFIVEVLLNGSSLVGTTRTGYTYALTAYLGTVALIGIEYEFIIGDKIKVLARRSVGTSVLETLANERSFRIDSIRLAAGNSTSFPQMDANSILALTSPTNGQIIYNLSQSVYVFYKIDTWKYLCGEETLMPSGIGDGPSGIFVEDFEGTFTDNWVGTPSINLAGTQTQGALNKQSGPTPSVGTGTQSAQNNTYYCYAEISGGQHVTEYLLETSNFKRLTDVDFYYQLEGADCGTLEFQYRSSGSTSWTTAWSITGDQGTPWNFVTLNLFGNFIERIRFKYAGASGWAGDLCLDYIVITSVD